MKIKNHSNKKSFGYIDDRDNSSEISSNRIGNYDKQVIKYAERLKYQHESNNTGSTPYHTDDEYLEIAQRYFDINKFKSYVSMMRMVYNPSNPVPNPEWSGYSYLEILNMANNGVYVPKDVLFWAKAQEEADIISYQVVSDDAENSENASTKNSSADFDINNLKNNVKENIVKAAAQQDKSQAEVDKSAVVINTFKDLQRRLNDKFSRDELRVKKDKLKEYEKISKERELTEDELNDYKALKKELSEHKETLSDTVINGEYLEDFLESMEKIRADNDEASEIADSAAFYALELSKNEEKFSATVNKTFDINKMRFMHSDSLSNVLSFMPADTIPALGIEKSKNLDILINSVDELLNQNKINISDINLLENGTTADIDDTDAENTVSNDKTADKKETTTVDNTENTTENDNNNEADILPYNISINPDENVLEKIMTNANEEVNITEVPETVTEENISDEEILPETTEAAEPVEPVQTDELLAADEFEPSYDEQANILEQNNENEIEAEGNEGETDVIETEENATTETLSQNLADTAPDITLNAKTEEVLAPDKIRDENEKSVNNTQKVQNLTSSLETPEADLETDRNNTDVLSQRVKTLKNYVNKIAEKIETDNSVTSQDIKFVSDIASVIPDLRQTSENLNAENTEFALELNNQFTMAEQTYFEGENSVNNNIENLNDTVQNAKITGKNAQETNLAQKTITTVSDDASKDLDGNLNTVSSTVTELDTKYSDDTSVLDDRAETEEEKEEMLEIIDEKEAKADNQLNEIVEIHDINKPETNATVIASVATFANVKSDSDDDTKAERRLTKFNRDSSLNLRKKNKKVVAVSASTGGSVK